MRISSALIPLLTACLLHAAVLARPASPPGHAATLAALTNEYRGAERAFYTTFANARTDAERSVLWEKKHPARAFLPRFQALAKRAQGTDPGARALIWIVQQGGYTGNMPAVGNALRTLTSAYIRSPLLKDAAEPLRGYWPILGAGQCQAALRAMATRSPHRPVQAAARFVLATLLSQSAAKEGQTEARALLHQVKREYPESPYAEQAESFLFQIENLQIGLTAPDFEATDQDGKTFRLSDYRGKVVVLDFWGFW